MSYIKLKLNSKYLYEIIRQKFEENMIALNEILKLG